MSKQRNSNIGHMVCPLDGCSTQAAVRRNVAGKLYCDCPDHGRITPNLPEGQDMMMSTANIWGAGGPPGECAVWIAEQWSWGRVMRDPAARDPVNGGDPVKQAEPDKQGDPVDEAASATKRAPVNRPDLPPPPPATAPKQPAAPKKPAPEPEPETQPEETEDDFA